MFRTANNLTEAMSEIKQHTYPYDSNTIHSLVMMYHNTLLSELKKEGRLVNIYIVKPGDSLYSIAETYTGIGENWKILAEMNEVDPPDLIYPNQVLKIPVDW